MSSHSMTSAAVRAARSRIVGLGSVGVALAALVLWAVLSQVTFVIPSPTETLRSFVGNITDETFLLNLRASMGAAGVSFLLGTFVGVVAGVVLGLFEPLRTIFWPTLTILYSVPKIVLYPMFLPVLGIGYGSKIAMGFLLAVFPVLVAVAVGVQGIPRVYWRLARSIEASRVQTLFFIVMPAIRGALLTAIRLAASLSILGVVISEFFASNLGVGRLVLAAYTTADYTRMVSMILVMVLISFVITMALWRLEVRANETTSPSKGRG